MNKTKYIVIDYKTGNQFLKTKFRNREDAKEAIAFCSYRARGILSIRQITQIEVRDLNDCGHVHNFDNKFCPYREM